MTVPRVDTMLPPLPEEEQTALTVQGFEDFKRLHLQNGGAGTCLERTNGKLCRGTRYSTGGMYCTEPRCPASREGHYLVRAILRGDLIETVRLYRLIFGDSAPVCALGDFIMTVTYR